jgi:hypothetical protein
VITFHAAKKGPLEIWENPLAHVKYCAGIDAGEGIGQEDSVTTIYRRDTGCQVLEYCSSIQDPEEFAYNSIVLLKHYNEAYVVPERNGPGSNVVIVLRNHYKRSQIYRERVENRREFIRKEEYGRLTSRTTRVPLIMHYKSAVLKKYVTIRSKALYEQLLSFIRKNGRMDHADDAKDDRIFASALATIGFVDIRVLDEIQKEEKKKTGITITEFVKGVRKTTTKQPDFIIGSDQNLPNDFSFLI